MFGCRKTFVTPGMTHAASKQIYSSIILDTVTRHRTQYRIFIMYGHTRCKVHYATAYISVPNIVTQYVPFVCFQLTVNGRVRNTSSKPCMYIKISIFVSFITIIIGHQSLHDDDILLVIL